MRLKQLALLGLALGTWATAQTGWQVPQRTPLPSPGGPRALLLADFDGDGRQELAVANAVQGTLGLYRRSRGGEWKPAGSWATGAGAGWLVAADFNGDGRLDVAATAVSEGHLVVLVQDAQGGFQRLPPVKAGAAPVAVATGDWNADGRTDCAVCAAAPGEGDEAGLLYFAGRGDGRFEEPAVVGGPCTALVAADFDGDGKADLATNGTNAIELRRSLGGGRFADPIRIPTPAPALGLLPVELYGGGRADLAAALENNQLALFRNEGKMTFQAAGIRATGRSPRSIAAADLNGDGLTDLLVANTGEPFAPGQSVSVFLGSADGGLAERPVTLLTGWRPHCVLAGEAEDRRGAEILTADIVSNTISVFTPDRRASIRLTEQWEAGPGVRALAGGDFDGDGRPDTAAAYAGGLAIRWGGRNTVKRDERFASAVQLASADLNFDGKDELIVAEAAPPTLHILRMSASGEWERTMTAELPRLPAGVKAVPDGDQNVRVAVLVTDPLGSAPGEILVFGPGNQGGLDLQARAAAGIRASALAAIRTAEDGVLLGVVENGPLPAPGPGAGMPAFGPGVLRIFRLQADRLIEAGSMQTGPLPQSLAVVAKERHSDWVTGTGQIFRFANGSLSAQDSIRFRGPATALAAQGSSLWSVSGPGNLLERHGRPGPDGTEIAGAHFFPVALAVTPGPPGETEVQVAGAGWPGAEMSGSRVEVFRARR